MLKYSYSSSLRLHSCNSTQRFGKTNNKYFEWIGNSTLHYQRQYFRTCFLWRFWVKMLLARYGYVYFEELSRASYNILKPRCFALQNNLKKFLFLNRSNQNIYNTYRTMMEINKIMCLINSPQAPTFVI